jgi:hypothetical protein
VSVAWQYHWIFGLIAGAMILASASLSLTLWAAYYLATAHRREAQWRLELQEEGEEPSTPSERAGQATNLEAINEARKRAIWHPHPDSEPFDRV